MVSTHSQPSPLARQLGYAGLAPFVRLATLLWIVRVEQQSGITMAQLSYAALIASFLGGLHTWVEKGDVNHVATSDTKGFSNHGNVQDNVKTETYASSPATAVSDTKSDISSTQAVSDSGSSQSQSLSGGQ